MRGVPFVAAALVCFSLLALAAHADTIISGLAWEQMPLPVQCRPGDNGISVYNQTDLSGNRIEIWCNDGQYQMKFIKPDGTVTFVGKCPFPLGRNSPLKLVNTTLRYPPAGPPSIVNKTIVQTLWISHDAHNPATGATRVNKDRAWVYSPATGVVIQQNTTHTGTWVNSSGTLEYNATNHSKDGSPGNLGAPRTPGALGAVLPPVEGGFMDGMEREYAYRTPTPVPGTRDGREITAVFTLPVEGDAQLREIVLHPGEQFTFDVEYPYEDVGLVMYELLEGPEGMELDAKTGALSWTPTGEGRYDVAVQVTNAELDPVVHAFTLPVVASPEPKEEQRVGWLVPAIALILAALLIVVWLFSRKRQ